MSTTSSPLSAIRGRIVCGTDFSVHAAEAADAAVHIARKTGDSLLLVHAEDPAAVADFTPEVRKQWQHAMKLKMRAEVQRLCRSHVGVEQEVTSGAPYSALASLSEQPETRLIVVASIGQVSPAQWFIGSTAERTAAIASKPVLIVRNSRPFLDWEADKRPLKILVAVDFSRTAEAALAWATSFSEFGTCELLVMHVTWPEGQWQRGEQDPTTAANNIEAAQRRRMRDLEAQTRTRLGKQQAEFRVESTWGRIDFHLIDIAKCEGADLIVVGTHQRQGVSRYWFGSVSRGLLHHAPTNIVIVPQVHLAGSDLAIPKINCVLVATDFSECANNAIPHAYSLVRKGGIVKLLHVTAPEGGRRKGKGTAEFEDKIKQYKDELQKLVPKEAASLPIETGVDVVENDHIAGAICEAADRFGADLICIGSHGRSSVMSIVTGSIAQAVIAASHKPVVVVRPS